MECIQNCLGLKWCFNYNLLYFH